MVKSSENMNPSREQRNGTENVLYSSRARKRTRQSNDSLAASSTRLCRQLLARSDLDALVGSSRSHSGSAHAVLDLLSHRHERLLNIGGALG